MTETSLTIKLPEAGSLFKRCENMPALFVATLENCDGDLAAYCAQFSTESTSGDRINAIGILFKTMRTLNKPGNEKHLADWNAILTAFQEAKLAFAKHNVVQFLGDYKPAAPKKGASVSIDQAIKYTKILQTLCETKEMLPAVAPLPAVPIEPTGPPRQTELDKIFNTLQEPQEAEEDGD